MPRVKDGSKDWEDLSQTQGACPTCRSVIYAATDTGFWVCENGHQAAGLWTQEAEGGDNEDGNPGEQRSQLRSIPVGKRARRSRTLFRSEQEQLSGAQDDVFDYTSGLDGTKRGTLILLHALQFILRAQIDFVVEHYRLGSNEPGREVQFRENAKKYWLHFASTMHGMVIKPKARLLHNSESDDDISTDSRTTMEFFGKKPKIELLGQRHVLIVVYLALLSIEMPVFPADLSRLVKSELMPFHIDRTNRLIVPPKLLVGIDEFGMRSLFSSKPPAIKYLESEIAHVVWHLENLAEFRAIPSVRVRECILRLFFDLSLPCSLVCYLPMVERMMALHGAPHRYNTRMACLVSPVVGLISSVVYFVIMLYDLWSSPNQDTIGKQKTKKRMIHLNRMGLPNLHELVNRWELLVNADGNPVFSDPEALRIKEGIDQSENSYWCVPWGSMGSVLRILKETLSQPISSRINDNEDLDFFHRQWVSEFETLPSWMFIEPNTEMFTEFFEWIPESIRISTTCTKSLNIENYEVQLLLSIIQRVTGFPNADVMGGVWALYVRPLVDGLVDKDLSRRDSN